MKSVFRRAMMSAAFVVGLAVPLAATWTTPAQALSACTVLSGGDTWVGVNADSTTFVVTASPDGLSVVGSPPPIASLPLVLTSSNGNRLSITATATGRWYEGTFTGETEQNCSCGGWQCDAFTTACTPQTGSWCNITGNSSCLSGGCGGGGNCSGGTCTGSVTVTAAG